MASVKVAVRVRPFNQREIDLNSDTIIDMVENKTTISNPKIPEASEGDFSREKRKEFTYDYSYWSLEKQRNNFASQLRVFDDIGRGVIQSAFEGYNCCIFAYGQTGSGKSYTMMGAPGTDDEGLIPRICQGLFEGMQEKNDLNSSFRTEVSYLEIYNERVRDLLKVNKGMYSLRVREHPKDGPYVQDLSKHLVMDYGDIFTLMDRGNSVRTTASTNMNDVSSRSHAIFTIKFIQAKLVNDLPSETVSKIHLVDLAGSERADASGATGQRLKEGGSINKSLVSLGNVISTLADMSGESGKGRRFFVPYRDSVLTWLLKDSIGGNSKTIMIATISPASVNYAETLSTLRYANRAKNIINKPTINEDPNVKLIRELQAEIARLKDLLGGNVNLRNTQVEERLHENESRVKMLTDEWQEKWREMGMLQMDHRLALRKEGAGIVLDSELPHLVGVDDDLLSTGVIFFNLSEGQTRLGLDDRLDVVLKGADVLTEHCILQNDAGVVTLLPAEGAICYVDGVRVQGPTRLFQGAVLVFGRTNKFRFNHPEEARKLRSEGMWGAGMNLSRISLLSQSYNDLSTDNIVTDGEERQKKEHELLEAKRREIHQLEQSFQQMEQQRHVEEQKHEESIEDKRHELEQLRREISALKQERRAQMLKRLAVLSPEQRGSYEQLQKQFVALYDEENNLAVQQNTAKERLQQDSQQAEQSATDEALRLRTALAAQEEQLRQAKETVEQARKKQAEARTELSSTRSRLAVEEERLQELRSSFEAKMAELEGKGQSFEDYVAEEKKDIDKMWNALQLIEQSRKSTYDEIEAEIKDMEAKMLVEYDEELNAAVRSSEENEAAQEELKSLLANCTNPEEEEQLRHRLQLLEDEHNRLLAQKDAADTKRRNMEDEIRHEWEGLDHLRDRDREDLEEDRRQLTEQEAALNWPQRIEEKQMRILQLKDELLSRDVDLEDTDDVARQRQTEFDRLAIQVAERRAAMTQSEIEIGRRLELEQSRVGADLRALEDERRKVVERITAERKEVELKLESLEDSLCPAEPLRRLSVLEEQSELDRHSVESRRVEIEQGHGEKESMERQRHSVELDRLSDPDDSREDREQNITLPDTSTPTGQPSLRHAISLPGLVISGVMDLSPDSSWEAKRSRYIQQINASLRWSVNDDVRLDVEIPSYLRRGYGVDVHYEYEVRLTVNHERWSVFRRYSKFLELHRFLKKRHVSLQSLPFPPKRFLFNRSDRFLAQRRSQLEMYLRELLRRLVEDAHSPLNPERLRLSGTPLSKRVMCDFNEFFQKGNFETSKHEMG